MTTARCRSQTRELCPGCWFKFRLAVNQRELQPLASFQVDAARRRLDFREAGGELRITKSYTTTYTLLHFCHI